MRLDCLEGFGNLEGIEGVEGLERLYRPERLERPKRQSWAFGCFSQFLALKKPRNTKTGLEKDIHFLVTDCSDR